MTDLNQSEIIELLRQHVDAGCDAVLADAPVDHYAAAAQEAEIAPQATAFSEPQKMAGGEHMASREHMAENHAPNQAANSITAPNTIASPKPVAPQNQTAAGTDEAVAEAKALAQAANSLEELQAAMHGFDGCALKTTAKNTVFSDGQASAKIMLIGEAPGQDEDRAGLPFVGASGQFLDTMLASIGLGRTENLYIANIVPWRPPGNRTPSLEEIAICKPFITRHIELIAPDYLLLVGNISNKTLLGTETGITKLRGQWQSYQADGREIKALPLLHPAYVLRRPENKAAYWADLCGLKAALLNA